MDGDEKRCLAALSVADAAIGECVVRNTCDGVCIVDDGVC